MIKEKSAGTIVYNNGKFLVLHYTAGHWDFPKGHMEKRETEAQTALRELKEETGIDDAYFVKGFEEKIKYFFKRDKELVHKEVTFYIVETKTKDIQILTNEHQGYEWLPYEKAIQRVTFPNAKGILRKAHDYLSRQ